MTSIFRALRHVHTFDYSTGYLTDGANRQAASIRTYWHLQETLTGDSWRDTISTHFLPTQSPQCPTYYVNRQMSPRCNNMVSLSSYVVCTLPLGCLPPDDARPKTKPVQQLRLSSTPKHLLLKQIALLRFQWDS
jgi:hypothetical protein